MVNEFLSYDGILDFMPLLFQDNRIIHTHDVRLLDSLERARKVI